MQNRQRLGAVPVEGGVIFSVASRTAARVEVSLFDETGETEVARLNLSQLGKGLHSLLVPGLEAGTRYGFRADGEYAPARGLWFDPAKLLMDPYALAIDRAYAYDPRLAAPRGEGVDTAPLMPKAIVTHLPEPLPPLPPLFRPGGLIYEVQVKAFTKRHPAIPEAERGTIAALAHPAVIEHLLKLHVGAVELMPVVAWIDERHLPPLALVNAWGYNPVTFMALDPRLAPGGLAELRATVAALREAGIGVILDMVFNHTGEGDVEGPTLAFRGLDNPNYYRHAAGDLGTLANETGTGNTVDCDSPTVQALVLDTLRHFVRHAGVDGFRFDLAPVLGRDSQGFDPNAPLLKAIVEDQVLHDRVLIAEPWDIGVDGYQLGNFPPRFLEWNDRYRDDVRRFWRGDAGMAGALATRLAGSSDIFGGTAIETRSVNFIAAHDGMTLADLTAFSRKHNEANGEENRDGRDENFSWNCGEEGRTEDAAIRERRRNDCAALLATLFFSRGTIMLTAGDEFGRSQRGNNNAYAQDNELTWLDWRGVDAGLRDYAFFLSRLRAAFGEIASPHFLSGHARDGEEFPDVAWLAEEGRVMQAEDWRDPGRKALAMVLAASGGSERIAVLVNGHDHPRAFVLPARRGFSWHVRALLLSGRQDDVVLGMLPMPARTVLFLVEKPDPAGKETHEPGV